MLSDFVEYLQNEWEIGYSGIIGYMNALGHLLDFRRTCSHSFFLHQKFICKGSSVSCPKR